MKNRLTRLLIFVASFLIISAVYVLNQETQTVEIASLYLVFPVVAALIGLYTSRIYGFKNTNGRAMTLIAVSLTCWAVAEIIFYISDNFVTSASLAPQLGDVFFLLGYPIFGAGVYQGYITAGIKLKNVNKTLLTTALIVSAILTVLVAYFGVYQVYDSTADLATNILNIGYGVGDLIVVIASMLMVLVAREYKGGKLALFWTTVTLGNFFLLIADVVYCDIYGTQILADMKPYTYNDLVWVAGYLIIVYGMLENYLHISAVQNKVKLKLLQRK
jgi:hypothetical protein